MEALDAAAGLIADSCGAGPIEGAVRAVDLLDDCFSDRFSCLPDTAGRLHARDGGDQARAGDPETRRHLARPFVLDYARQAERASGRNTERPRPAPELPCDSVVVSRGFRHQATEVSGPSRLHFRHKAIVAPGRWRFHRTASLIMRSPDTCDL